MPLAMPAEPQQPPPQSPKRRFGKLRIIALILAGLFISLAAIAHLTIAPTIRHKLQAAIAARLDASLTIGDLTYRPPFTVHLYDVHFIAHPDQPGGGTELLWARRIDLSLAKLPLGAGPLLIERFAIDGLTLHAIRTREGKYLGLDLAGSSHPSTSNQAMKLSDVLRLRHFSLKNASLIYQDQAIPTAAPTQWQGINSEIALVPQSASLYGFQFDASDAPIATANVSGSLDVDSLLLQIKQLTASVQAPTAEATAGPDPLPPELRDLLRRYSVGCTIILKTTGQIPLKDPDRASFKADLTVAGGRAVVPSSGEKLDDLTLAIHASRETADSSTKAVKLNLTQFRATSAGAILQLASASASIDPGTGKWSINNLSGSLESPPANRGPWNLTGHADFHADLAHDPGSNQTPFIGGINFVGLNLQPPGLAAPLQGLTGSIHFAGTNPHDRQIDFQNLSASYGTDHLLLDHAQIGFAQFPDSIAITDIQSHINLAAGGPAVPGDLGDVLQTFNPTGPFAVTGTAAMKHVIRDEGPGYSPEWDLAITTQNGNLALSDSHFPITALNGQLLATKHAISIPSLHGSLLGGTVDFQGTARVVEPIVYEGECDLTGASVSQFADFFQIKSPDGKEPSGTAGLGFKFFSKAPGTMASASTTAAATQPTSELDEWLSLLGGDGSLQIDDGNLWALPALQSLSKHTRIAREALTAGEAAAVFTIANRTIYFKHVAVYSPALGLQGSGTESFDGQLDLDIIAAPLGDWKQKLAETDIPFFSRVLSGAAGTVEKLVGSATSALLYHFHITGSHDNPIVQTIPAPFLTDSAANLFTKMIHHDGNTKLVDSVGEK
jgi:hypothetical protein